MKGWQHTQVISTVSQIRKLKASKGRDLHVWGSSELVHLLMKHDLVDVLRLKIHPDILGKGKKLFNTTAAPASFKLTQQLLTTTGVIIAVYKRKGSVKTGAIGE